MICEHFTDQSLKPLSVHEHTHQMQTYYERRKKLCHGSFKGSILNEVNQMMPDLPLPSCCLCFATHCSQWKRQSCSEDWLSNTYLFTWLDCIAPLQTHLQCTQWRLYSLHCTIIHCTASLYEPALHCIAIYCNELNVCPALYTYPYIRLRKKKQ